MLAEKTLEILRKGEYRYSILKTVQFKELIDYSIFNSKTYKADELTSTLARTQNTVSEGQETKIILNGRKSITAALEVMLEGEPGRIAILNFANPFEPGGGFRRDARAQEEDLCRNSALFPCLQNQRDFYERNVLENSEYFTNDIIFSPEVPFFRDDDGNFLSEPKKISVITSAAPFGWAQRTIPKSLNAKSLEEVIINRILLILSCADIEGIDTLVLGAWGCGAFKNDPEIVAAAFHSALTSPKFKNRFSKVIFAVWCPISNHPNWIAFTKHFPNKD